MHMLGEFFDIVSNNVPDGLPPMRKISHQMDLVLVANFLHKMTPTESKELNRKVHELLQKGLIQESLSLGVVVVIVTPNKNW